VKRILVRDNRAGIYVGEVPDNQDMQVSVITLYNVRHIWYWQRAAATTGIATRGLSRDSKIGPVQEWIVLRDIVSISPVTAEADAKIAEVPEWTP